MVTCQEERQISAGYCQTFPDSLNNIVLSAEKCRVHSEPCLLYVTKVRHEMVVFAKRKFAIRRKNKNDSSLNTYHYS